MTRELAIHWGDELVELARVEGGAPIVVAGVIVTAPRGRLGLVDYAVREVGRPTHALPYARGDGQRLLPYLAAALVLHVGLWGLATQHPPDLTVSPTTTRSPRPARIGRPAAPRAALPAAVARDRSGDTKASGEGRAMKDAEGAAGTRTPAPPRGHVAIANTGEEPQLAKAELLAQARRAGVLGSARVLDEAVQTLAGADKLTSAFDQLSATAPVDGPDGNAAGRFGLGRSGFGPGGGGTGWGTIGTGNAGAYSGGTTHGHGWGGSVAPVAITWSRDWGDHAYAYMPVHHGPSRAPIVAVCPDLRRCHVSGELDAAVVRRYVKRNIQKLAYCYEKELVATPQLGKGELALDFTIRADGSVGQVHAAGISERVASCVGGVIEQLELPGGGVTQVEYVLVYDPRAR